MKHTLRIGTRASLLAVTQSIWVKDQIEARYPDCTVELVKITTKGDKILDVPLAKVGGKGLFVKEIEDALLDGRVDLAVHSMKDVPTALPTGLEVAIITVRETPLDAFVSNIATSLNDLPEGACIGTSSLRRRAQLARLRPDITITDLRGNLDTRLKKLDDGDVDAIILAGAGLNRLNRQDRIASLFSVEEMLPAIGQGALGLELRQDDTGLCDALSFLHHEETAIAVTAERALLLHLEGGCQVPIGAHATYDGYMVTLTGLVARIDGSQTVRESRTASPDQAASLGVNVANLLLDQGGRAILEELYDASRQ
ncbi:MAG: hydroxymethylbilane synthase [Deltaproteobacteria bacterium]|nr:MAG: hydroxymethylbilane synthase [Deltaproteobacteria bacterium]